ncbi:CotO family spore coat protein [Pontibacillus litoralis]|uniref:Spore coat protein CotO n=1 Tax=Pontibacillus litoralis JSM 072002 TaxID=1385512 RepID=A0A0A5G9F3_9BACI|nr:CotO family spore coat protein [Pontibacillus litoralis]KGX87808.1 hypothetical protein N784_13895 [Pontibacillus litoralis JSM 072002]
MARRRDKAKEPMLYITQPEFQSAQPNMQSTYRSSTNQKQKKSAIDTVNTAEKKRPTLERRKKRRLSFDLEIAQPMEKENDPFEDADDVQHDVEVLQPDVDSSVDYEEEEHTDEIVTKEEATSVSKEDKTNTTLNNRKRRKSFKDMNVEDKVNYFLDLPPQVPRMKCEVVTEEDTYRGWIENCQDGVVQMKLVKRPFRADFPISSIQNIYLRGF